jgi:WD40 repeat protein
VRALEFSSDGRWILAASTDGAVLVWDVPAAGLRTSQIQLTHRLKAPGIIP